MFGRALETLHFQTCVREYYGCQIIRKVAHSRDVTLGGRRKDSVLNPFFAGQKLDNLNHSFGFNIVLSKIL